MKRLRLLLGEPLSRSRAVAEAEAHRGDKQPCLSAPFGAAGKLIAAAQQQTAACGYDSAQPRSRSSYTLRYPALALAGLAAALLLVGCGAGSFESENEGSAGLTREQLTTAISGPTEIETYSSFPLVATVTDQDGKLVSGLGEVHFAYRHEDQTAETEVEAHEIGSSGVYAIGTPGQGSTHSLSLTMPGEYHVHFRFEKGAFEYEGELEAEVESGHREVESGGTEYKVTYSLEEDGQAVGEVHEGETDAEVVFNVSDHDSGAAVTTLTPIVYIAEQGGDEATTGTTFNPASDAEGNYRVPGFTWSEAGNWDVAVDLDGNAATHDDRTTWTQAVAHEH